MNPVKELIREKRLHKKMSQTKLAKLVGCHKNTIAMYEQGHRTPPLPRLIELAKILDFKINKKILDLFSVKEP